MKKRILLTALAAVMLLPLAGCWREEAVTAEKPVIYLYPEEATAVEVRLDYAGELTYTWPKSDGCWSVTAQPDGTLTDADGHAYSYLFWEGETSAMRYDFSQGFCVAGEDTGDFLRDTLSAMGLTPAEYNEFIVYWMPQMEGSAYNLISFQGETYTDCAKLTVTPAPDSVLRVFMAWKPLDAPVDIEQQTFEAFERTGFTLVEWGGTQVD